MRLRAERFSPDLRAFELRIFIETVVNNPARTMQKLSDDKILFYFTLQKSCFWVEMEYC